MADKVATIDPLSEGLPTPDLGGEKLSHCSNYLWRHVLRFFQYDVFF